MKKRGQSGLVTGLVFGIASLVIATIIGFVIVSTLINANLFGSGTVNVSAMSDADRARLSTGNMSGNFSEGVDEVSDQLPTVLLIAAVVLIIGVLAILVAIWQGMKMGGRGDAGI